MLDTLRRVPTPEGFELTLRLAGPVPRALAFAIDLTIRVALFGAIAGLLGHIGGAGKGLILIIAFLLEWFYPVVCEVWWNGATPGKRAFGLVVLNDNGTPVTFGASLTRNLLRAVDFLPMLRIRPLPAPPMWPSRPAMAPNSATRIASFSRLFFMRLI